MAAELMVHSGVQDAHQDRVNSHIDSLQHEEAVSHHSEPNISFAVALIAKFILKQRYFAIFKYRIVFPQLVNWYFLMLIEQFKLDVLILRRRYQHLLLMCAQINVEYILMNCA